VLSRRLGLSARCTAASRDAPGAHTPGALVRVTFNHGKDPSLGDKVLGILTVVEPDERGVRYEGAAV
jgi:hypothetical protein